MSFVIDGDIYSFEYSDVILEKIIDGGFFNKLDHALQTKNLQELMYCYGFVIGSAYIWKSEDQLYKFTHSGAYTKIFNILTRNSELSRRFFNGII